MMDGDFKIGEILIFQNSLNSPELNNREVELTGGWELRQCGYMDHAQKRVITKEELCYQVRFQTGHELNCQKFHLRRKKPPTREIDTKVSWEDCDWTPHRVEEKA